jgi:hypothetical protein
MTAAVCDLISIVMSSEVETSLAIKLRFLDFARNNNDKLCKHLCAVVCALSSHIGALVSDAESAEDSRL